MVNLKYTGSFPTLSFLRTFHLLISVKIKFLNSLSHPNFHADFEHAKLISFPFHFLSSSEILILFSSVSLFSILMSPQDFQICVLFLKKESVWLCGRLIIKLVLSIVQILHIKSQQFRFCQAQPNVSLQQLS